MIVTHHLSSYSYDPLLRRPFSICDIEGDSFKILIQLAGKGTSLLKNIKADTRIEFSSEVGNGFSIVNNKSVAVIAGGVGIAPFLWLTKKLKQNNNKIDLFYGEKTSNAGLTCCLMVITTKFARQTLLQVLEEWKAVVI